MPSLNTDFGFTTSNEESLEREMEWGDSEANWLLMHSRYAIYLHAWR